MVVLDAIADGATTLGVIVEQTGINRATAHRLAQALEAHGLVRRDEDGGFVLGYRLWALGQRVGGPAMLTGIARPLIEDLRDQTGESAQLFVPDGDARLCVVSVESPHGLRTIVPVGSRLRLDLGSGAAALRSDLEADGWSASVGQRVDGAASVSAPVVVNDVVVAAVSVSGPIDRLTDDPGSLHGDAVVACAATIADRLT